MPLEVILPKGEWSLSLILRSPRGMTRAGPTHCASLGQPSPAESADPNSNASLRRSQSSANPSWSFKADYYAPPKPLLGLQNVRDPGKGPYGSTLTLYTNEKNWGPNMDKACPYHNPNQRYRQDWILAPDIQGGSSLVINSCTSTLARWLLGRCGARMRQIHTTLFIPSPSSLNSVALASLRLVGVNLGASGFYLIRCQQQKHEGPEPHPPGGPPGFQEPVTCCLGQKEGRWVWVRSSAPGTEVVSIF